MRSLSDFLEDKIINQTIVQLTDPPYFRVPRKERVVLEDRISSLLNNSKDEYHQVEFSHFIVYILDTYIIRKGNEIISDNIPLWFQNVISMINHSSTNIPTLDDIVNSSCKCAEHVSRSFKKYLNITPSRYLTGIKLKKAAELLRNTNYSINEICFLSLYGNSNYFHKQFCELYDQTPSDYRKSHSRYIH